jgi:hypothetical protein
MIAEDARSIRAATVPMPDFFCELIAVSNGFVVKVNGRPHVVQLRNGSVDEFEDVLDAVRMAYQKSLII